MNGYSGLELQEQLMTQLEEMQTEIDEYKQIIAELRSELSKSATSSQVQELILTVQQQRNKIAQQTELIEKLNESDLILQENDKLKKLNSDLQIAKQNAEAKIMSFKKAYAAKERELIKAQERADTACEELESLQKRQNELVKAKANKIYQSKSKRLTAAYKAKERALKIADRWSLLIFIAMFLFMLINDEYGEIATYTLIAHVAYIAIRWWFCSTDAAADVAADTDENKK